MPNFSVALNRAGVNTANTVLAEMRTTASARMTLWEMIVTMAVLPTTAPRLVLARATNTPAGGTNNAPLQDDPAGTGPTSAVSFFLTGQSTVPTFATSGPWHRVTGLPLTLGAAFVWSFPRGLVVPVSGSLLLANLNASGATLGSFDISANWSE
jgi:hypothetical protein